MSFYKEKISFPYVRRVGVKGKKVEFKEGEEKSFLEFLKNPESAFLWSDSVDLHALCNMYNMKIKIVTTYSAGNIEPKVYWCDPDPEMDDSRLIPQGVVADITLINYDEKHFNLVISKPLLFGKTCSNSTNDETLQKRLNSLVLKVEESQLVVFKLRKELADLKREIRHEDHDRNKTDELIKVADMSIDEDEVKDNDDHEVIEIVKEKPVVNIEENSDSSCNLPVDKSLFECKTCERRFKLQSLLKKHIEDNHGRKYFSCDICKFNCQSKQELKNHQEMHSEGKTSERSLNCHLCGNIFSTKTELMNHRRDQHRNSLKLCRYFASGNCHFDDNLCWYKHQTHQPKNSEVKCSFCDNVFKTKSDLRNHLRENHAPESSTQCIDFKNGSCKMSTEDCWFQHNENEEASEKKSGQVFPNGLLKSQPPDSNLMDKIMGMMQMLFKEMMIAEQNKLE